MVFIVVQGVFLMDHDAHNHVLIILCTDGLTLSECHPNNELKVKSIHVHNKLVLLIKKFLVLLEHHHYHLFYQSLISQRLITFTWYWKFISGE
jgi:hypothetical protein